MNKMKRSFMQIKIIAVVILLLSACSQEDEYVTKGENEIPSQRIEITVSARDFVTDGTPDTRATDDGNKTTFEDGDRVGIIILDKKNNLIYDNIPYVYNNGNWTFDSKNDEGKGGCYYDTKAVTYIVYYPYSRAADEVTSVNNLKARFAPKFNQSDIEDYRSSDLMVWNSSILTPPVMELDAELEHAFASVYLAPTVNDVILDDGNRTLYTGSYVSEVSSISDVNLTIDDVVYVPFQATDGSLLCIIPADITPGDIRCFYTISSKTYGNVINISDKVVANTRYACQPEIKDVTYSLTNAHVGDFYCKKNSSGEGYLIPGDVNNLIDDQIDDCVGIVFWVGSEAFEEDPLLKSIHPDCTHGLVVALKDVGSAMNWSKRYESVQKNWVKTNNQYKDVVNLEEHYKMCGYSNTLALVEYNNAKGENSDYRVLPCDAIQQYSTTNSAPINSSDWFFPSLKELKYVCWGQEQSGGKAGRDYLNAQISKVSGGSQFGSDYHWSSTENDWFIDRAWYVGFEYGNLGNDGSNKYTKAFRVRPLLAF